VVEKLPGGLVARHFAGVPGCLGGGDRGCVHGFSVGSRRRLRRKLLEIDWSVVECSWLTVTYHLRWGDWRDWKRDLQAFAKRLMRRWGNGLLGWVWRLEFQERGAPHFHVILLWRQGYRLPKGVLQAWSSRSWGQVIGTEHDLDAQRHGVRVEDVGPGRGGLGRLLGYLVSEMGKVRQCRLVDRESGELLATGRVWGVVGGVPMRLGVQFDLSESGWSALIARVNAKGREVRSWYLSSISENWSGFTLLGSWSELETMLEGLTDDG